MTPERGRWEGDCVMKEVNGEARKDEGRRGKGGEEEGERQ